MRLVEETFAAGWQSGLGREMLPLLNGQKIQFTVTDGDSFYLEVNEKGSLLKLGVTEDPGAEVIRAREEVWRNIFSGGRRFVDAAWEGDLNARIYHGRGDLYFLLSSFVKKKLNLKKLY